MSNVNEKVDPTVDEKTGKTGQADTTITPVSASELAQSGTLHTVAPESTGHHSFYNDASITFEEYNFWANRSRDFEKHIPTSGAGIQGLFNTIIGRRGESSVVTTLERPIPVDASEHLPGGDKWGLTEMEWETAQRAARTATWGSVFYLITTDILGPYNVAFAISGLGYGPGVILYTAFFVTGVYSASLLWKVFCGLDSTRFPLRNYGDLAFRIYGHTARTVVNVLQSFQFFLNVAMLIVSNGQGLVQMAAGENGKGYLCFVVAEVVFTIAGFLLGQIRTLQRLSWLSNISIWLNIIVMITTMVVVHQYPPNYQLIQTSENIPPGPVYTYKWWPPSSSLENRMSSVMNCVFAYGGATIFTELMAEMRRPWDFWKGLICAEIFIYCCYLLMGLVIYSAQGQFTYNIAYQGISNSAYRFQTLGNAISFASGLIAALLYGNIGVKVFYSAVFRDLLKFPSLNEKKGKWIWVFFIPVYWALAFIVAAAIPQINNLTVFVGALCIFQFSYTFPPLLKFGYNIHRDAITDNESYNPQTGVVSRVDGTWKRWARGFSKKWPENTFNVLYGLASLATAGMGLWAAIQGMRQSFASTPLTPFTCKSPTG